MTYIFETIECEKSFGGSKIIFKEHRDIIEKYSEKGYKYIGFIPKSCTVYLDQQLHQKSKIL